MCPRSLGRDGRLFPPRQQVPDGRVGLEVDAGRAADLLHHVRKHAVQVQVLLGVQGLADQLRRDRRPGERGGDDHHQSEEREARSHGSTGSRNRRPSRRLRYAEDPGSPGPQPGPSAYLRPGLARTISPHRTRGSTVSTPAITTVGDRPTTPLGVPPRPAPGRQRRRRPDRHLGHRRAPRPRPPSARSRRRPHPRSAPPRPGDRPCRASSPTPAATAAAAASPAAHRPNPIRPATAGPATAADRCDANRSQSSPTGGSASIVPQPPVVGQRRPGRRVTRQLRLHGRPPPGRQGAVGVLADLELQLVAGTSPTSYTRSRRAVSLPTRPATAPAASSGPGTRATSRPRRCT